MPSRAACLFGEIRYIAERMCGDRQLGGFREPRGITVRPCTAIIWLLLVIIVPVFHPFALFYNFFVLGTIPSELESGSSKGAVACLF